MILYAYVFAAGLVTGIGIGAFQYAIAYHAIQEEELSKGIHDDQP